MQRSLLSSEKMDYVTPGWLYRILDNMLHFTLDPATSGYNPMGTEKFYTEKDDGLLKSWMGERVWLNPPYGRSISDWVKKAYLETSSGGCPLVMMLIPSRTDTSYFHSYIYPILQRDWRRVIFLPGRLKFSNHRNSAPFPSLLCLFLSKDLEIDLDKLRMNLRIRN